MEENDGNITNYIWQNDWEDNEESKNFSFQLRCDDN
jgi:hypothetical protein